MAYEKYHWATFLNREEDENLQEFVSFLFENRELESRSRYGAVKYLLKMAYNVLYNDKLVDMMQTLYKNKIIKNRTLIDAFNYALLLAENQIRDEYD